MISICVLAVCQVTTAQTLETDNLENLVFPEFEKSVVLLKTGQSYEATMNYEKTEQQMVVLRNNQLFLFKDHQAVDTILMGERIFVPAEKGFHELLVNAPVALFINHKARLENTGSTVAYGSKTNTAGITHITKIFGQEGAIVLKIPDTFKVIDDSEFLLRINGQMHKVINRKQFLKLFPSMKKELESYISKNDTDFKTAGDLIDLISFCNTASR